MSADTFYTIQATADLLGVSHNTVRRMIADGRLPCVRIGHRTVRITDKALADYAAKAQRVKP